MDTADALAVLGLAPGVDLATVRSRYRQLVRTHHPDIAGAGATERTMALTEAYRVLTAAAADEGLPPPPAPDPPPPDARTAGGTAPGDRAPVDVGRLDADSLLLDAPPDEAYVALFDAAARLGHIAYFDRHEGIIETIVRFEGGPSCSVLITLQGRAHGTEAFCTMDSIEAAPAPPIGPVLDALIEELHAPDPNDVEVRGRRDATGQDGWPWA